MTEIYSFLARGGIVMIPIALGSVIALAIFLERLWSLQHRKILPDGLFDRIMRLAEKRNYEEALTTCMESPSPLGRILAVGIRRRGMSRSEIKEILEEAGRREVSSMLRFVEALGVTASVEPLLGLLGTVTGMIQVFQQVVASARHGAIDPGQLASGIWEALITTAAGLVVAIPAFVAYRYLISRTDSLASEMEESALAIADELSSDSAKSKRGDAD